MSIEIETPCHIIKAQIHTGEKSGFIAECVDLPVITQGHTADQVLANLREAISLHLEGEDLASLGFTSDMPITVNYEIAIPLFPVSRQPVAWWRKKQTLTPRFAGLVVVLLWFLVLFGGLNIFESWQERGQFGDLFGSVNALFSGFAFVVLIYTIHLQRQELSLQRTELKLQREVMVHREENWLLR